MNKLITFLVPWQFIYQPTLYTTALSGCPLAYTSLTPKSSQNDGAANPFYFLNSSDMIIQSAAVQH